MLGPLVIIVPPLYCMPSFLITLQLLYSPIQLVCLSILLKIYLFFIFMMLKNKGNLPCFLPKIKYNADCTEKLLKEDRFIYFIIPAICV